MNFEFTLTRANNKGGFYINNRNFIVTYPLLTHDILDHPLDTKRKYITWEEELRAIGSRFHCKFGFTNPLMTIKSILYMQDTTLNRNIKPISNTELNDIKQSNCNDNSFLALLNIDAFELYNSINESDYIKHSKNINKEFVSLENLHNAINHVTCGYLNSHKLYNSQDRANIVSIIVDALLTEHLRFRLHNKKIKSFNIVIHVTNQLKTSSICINGDKYFYTGADLTIHTS